MSIRLLQFLDWAIIAVSFFNTIALLWLGLTVLLNAERRSWGTWIVGGGLLLGALVYAGHSAVVGRVIGTFESEMNLWWKVGWLPFVGSPYLWYLMTLWYTGMLRSGGHRTWLTIVSLLGLVGVALLLLSDPLPSYSEVVQRTPGTVVTILGLPVVTLIYPVFSVLCIVLSLSALRRPAASRRFMGDLARQRTRPWLVAASLVLLAISLAFGAMITWFLQSVQGQMPDLYFFYKLPLFMGFDLLISLLVATTAVLLGRAVVAYEIFTGKVLPRGGLRLQWRRSLILAAGYGAAMAVTLTYRPIDPIYQLLLATALMTLFFALLSWRTYAGRERIMERLRPFVASQRLYERLLAPTTPPEMDVGAPFRALCEDVLGARLAYLVPVGPLAPLVGPGVGYPAGLPPALGELALQLGSPQTLCRPLDPAQYGGAVWAVPLWSERGLIGVLLLGEKRDGGLYTQEEIEIARATGERLIDTQASAQLARRLMGLQRQRLAESQLLDRRTRRILHDDVLPRLHTAMLGLSGALGPGVAPEARASIQATIDQLMETHRQIADLLRSMPASTAPELGRLGLAGALRQLVEGELNGAFDSVDWQIDPEAQRVAHNLPPLTAEVLFYAAREALRNAARYGRNQDLSRPLHLQVSLTWRPGLQLLIEDNGVGLGSAKPSGQGSGQGLALHTTMMAVVGGTLTAESRPGSYTRIVLLLPPESCQELEESARLSLPAPLTLV